MVKLITTHTEEIWRGRYSPSGQEIIICIDYQVSPLFWNMTKVMIKEVSFRGESVPWLCVNICWCPVVLQLAFMGESVPWLCVNVCWCPVLLQLALNTVGRSRSGPTCSSCYHRLQFGSILIIVQAVKSFHPKISTEPLLFHWNVRQSVVAFPLLTVLNKMG